jgi:hypothetical protein
MTPQTYKVLKHLREHRNITSWEAIQLYHITRLSAKIYELRQMGYNISGTTEHNDETGTNYKRYFLISCPKHWSEDELTDLPKEVFTTLYDVADEEWEQLQKEFQEM